MAYDEQLAERVRTILGEDPGIGERKMFGGLAVMIDGNMAVGVMGDRLLVRVGADAWADAMTEPHVGEMDFTGRTMKGFVVVDAAGVAEEADLQAWIERGVEFAGSLPPK